MNEKNSHREPTNWKICANHWLSTWRVKPLPHWHRPALHRPSWHCASDVQRPSSNLGPLIAVTRSQPSCVAHTQIPLEQIEFSAQRGDTLFGSHLSLKPTTSGAQTPSASTKPLMQWHTFSMHTPLPALHWAAPGQQTIDCSARRRRRRETLRVGHDTPSTHTHWLFTHNRGASHAWPQNGVTCCRVVLLEHVSPSLELREGHRHTWLVHTKPFEHLGYPSW